MARVVQLNLFNSTLEEVTEGIDELFAADMFSSYEEWKHLGLVGLTHGGRESALFLSHVLLRIIKSAITYLVILLLLLLFCCC